MGIDWLLSNYHNRDITWELLSSCKELDALDNYLELRGAKAPQDLL